MGLPFEGCIIFHSNCYRPWVALGEHTPRYLLPPPNHPHVSLRVPSPTCFVTLVSPPPPTPPGSLARSGPEHAWLALSSPPQPGWQPHSVRRRHDDATTLPTGPLRPENEAALTGSAPEEGALFYPPHPVSQPRAPGSPSSADRAVLDTLGPGPGPARGHPSRCPESRPRSLALLPAGGGCPPALETLGFNDRSRSLFSN